MGVGPCTSGKPSRAVIVRYRSRLTVARGVRAGGLRPAMRSAMRRPWRASLQGHQLCIPLDGSPGGDVNGGDGSTDLGLHLVLHLHRFEHEEPLPYGDDVTLRHEDLHHASRHRALDDAASAAPRRLLCLFGRAQALALDADVRAVTAGHCADFGRRAFGRQVDHPSIDPDADLRAEVGDVQFYGALVDPGLELAIWQLHEFDDGWFRLRVGIERDVVTHSGNLLQLV